jgi:hypothetical protein
MCVVCPSEYVLGIIGLMQLTLALAAPLLPHDSFAVLRRRSASPTDLGLQLPTALPALSQSLLCILLQVVYLTVSIPLPAL